VSRISLRRKRDKYLLSRSRLQCCPHELLSRLLRGMDSTVKRRSKVANNVRSITNLSSTTQGSLRKSTKGVLSQLPLTPYVIESKQEINN
jgi:hypothetical protein